VLYLIDASFAGSSASLKRPPNPRCILHLVDASVALSVHPSPRWCTLRLVVALFAVPRRWAVSTSLGHLHRRWVARCVVGLFAIHWALHMSLRHSPCHGPCTSSLGVVSLRAIVSSLGHSSRCRAVRHIVWARIQSFGPRSHRLAYRRIAGLVIWSLGPLGYPPALHVWISPLGRRSPHRSALDIVVWPIVASLG